MPAPDRFFFCYYWYAGVPRRSIELEPLRRQCVVHRTACAALLGAGRLRECRVRCEEWAQTLGPLLATECAEALVEAARERRRGGWWCCPCCVIGD
jgi:hypothetical protein